MSTYTAHATRSDGWWAVTVPAVDGLITQTRRLDQIEDMVRDALELFPDIEDDPGSAVIDIVVAGTPHDIASRARELNAAAKDAQAAATAAMSAAAHDLAAEGLPFRDIGQLLGVSFQRAQKMAADYTPSAKAIPDSIREALRGRISASTEAAQQ